MCDIPHVFLNVLHMLDIKCPGNEGGTRRKGRDTESGRDGVVSCPPGEWRPRQHSRAHHEHPSFSAADILSRKAETIYKSFQQPTSVEMKGVTRMQAQRGDTGRLG